MNKVFLIGNLGRAVELRDVGGGRVVGKTIIAVSRVAPGGEKKGTDWIPVVLWDRQATNAARYLHKGARVATDGRLHGDFVPRRRAEGEDEGRQPSRLVVEVVVTRITYLSPRPAAGGGETADAGPEETGDGNRESRRARS